MKKPALYIALDLSSQTEALALAERTAPYAEGFKVGPGLLLKNSKNFIKQLKNYGKVFLDFKFFDIPSTMLRSVKSAFDSGADLVTVHALAGETALKALAGLETQLNTKRDFRILAVTILTSFHQRSLLAFLRPWPLTLQVENLADTVIKSGLKGLVCSGRETAQLKKRHPESYIVTPGIRLKKPAEEQKSDQERIFTPKEASRAGASALVVGRPIYQAEDPKKNHSGSATIPAVIFLKIENFTLLFFIPFIFNFFLLHHGKF